MSDHDRDASASPLPRRMWILAGVCALLALGAVAGLLVAGTRVDWDMEAIVTDFGRGGPKSLGFIIPVTSVFAVVCLAGACAFARQAVLLRSARSPGKRS